MTAETFQNPNTLLHGDQFASFLIGALDPNSEMIGGPSPNPIDSFFGLYIGDDWKVNRKLTITLGLRDEYEGAWHDTQHNLSQGLNLSQIDPAIAANPPSMPGAVTSLIGNNTSYNGAWYYTSNSHPGMWNPQLFAWEPRFGVAYRLNDKTAIRFGYARYVTPTSTSSHAATVRLRGHRVSGAAAVRRHRLSVHRSIAKRPAFATLSNPYPASSPLAPIGKSEGTNTGRGGSPLVWYPSNMQKEYNNRLNLTIEHELPGQIVVSGTFFSNFGDQQYNKNLNSVNPLLQQQYQGALNNSVPNPFYHYLNSTTIPGYLYNQPNVPLSALLVKYPLYGPLYQLGTLGASERYNMGELRVQKRFSHGYNFLFGYVYIREKAQQFNNDLQTYNNQLVWQDSNQPRNRVTFASSYEIPLGRGRAFLSTAPRVVDALVGGWQITGVLTYTSGDLPRFTQALNVSGSPCLSNPTPNHWFNTSVFSLPSGYQIMNNPIQYNCIKGPSFFDLDASLIKNFHLTEKVQMQLKMSAYNATNKLNRGDPDTNINDSTFGQALYQGSPGGQIGAQTATNGSVFGRQVEIGGKIIF